MIKIKSLKVKNFKSLADTSVDTFGELNMFFGFNNCGKSNVFRFLDFLFSKKTKRELVRITTAKDNGRTTPVNEELYNESYFYDGEIYNQPYLFLKNNRKQPIEFIVVLTVSNIHFPEQEELKKEGFLGVDNTEITFIGTIVSKDQGTSILQVKSAALNGKEFFKIDSDLHLFTFNKKSKLTAEVGAQILQLFENLVSYIDTDRGFSFESFKEGISTLDAQNFKNWLFELNINAEKNETFNELLKFLNEFEFTKESQKQLLNSIKSFPFNKNTQIGFARFGSEVEVMLNNDNGRFPLKSFGTGIQQFFFILVKIFNSSAKVVIIEELELNLSPRLQLEMLSFLKALLGKRYDQLLFSSHSTFFTEEGYDMLDAIHHVQIGNTANGGTNVDTITEISEYCGKDDSYFKILYS